MLVGSLVGSLVGPLVGLFVGLFVGTIDGIVVGIIVGVKLGGCVAIVGPSVGLGEGFLFVSKSHPPFAYIVVRSI